MRETSRGILMGAAASALWGTTYVVIRLLYRLSDLDAVGITFARFLVGGVALVGVLAACGRARSLRAAVEAPIPFFWLGLTGIAGMGILVTLASSLTATENTSLIINANPIFIALLAPLAGERLSPIRLAGALLGLAGLAVVVSGSVGSGPALANSRDLWGSLAAVGAALAWAAYTLIGKSVTRRHGGLLTTAAAMLWGTALLAAVLPAAHAPGRLHAGAVLLLVYLGLAPSALAYLLWYRGLALVDAAALGPTQYLAPLVTLALAWPLLGEQPGPAFLIGLVLVFAGIAIASRAGQDRGVVE